MKIKGVEVVRQDNFETYCKWVGRNLTNGTALAAYDCPHCRANLFTAIPATGDVADSLSNCPVCDGIYFKVVSHPKEGGPVVETITEPMID